MSKTALLFPGQGSQFMGMGRDLADAYSQARDSYGVAESLLGFALSGLCFEGPEEALDDTVNTQPAIFATSIATLRALEADARIPAPAMVAGHSLGELTALTAAEAIAFADGLRLVRERGRLMKLAGERRPGGMAAILKMDDNEVFEACRQASEETGVPVQIANHNSPGQVVISGDHDALSRAMDLLRQRGARRMIPLAVSIAAHSPLMATVVDEFRAAVQATPVRVPRTPIVGNISARPVTSSAEIHDELTRQLTQPVQWTRSIQWMIEQGVTCFVEVGPKDVLTKLVQRIDRTVEAISWDS